MNVRLALPRLSALALAALLASCVAPLPPQSSGDAYRIYRGDGAAASLEELYQAMKGADVTFLGESHDDSVAHQLEERILRDTWDANLALSLEMFETDVQLVVDEYLDGLVQEERFREDARAWDNYAGAYRPLLEFARDKDMPVLAANAPRRYVNLVGRMGAGALEELSPDALRYLPPLPYAQASPAYREKFIRLMSESMPEGSHQAAAAVTQTETGEATLSGPAQTADAALSSPAQAVDAAPSGPARAADAAPPSVAEPAHPGAARADDPFASSLEAQSLWDATMAWSLARHLQAWPQARLLHVNGSFHTEGRLGIVEQLEYYDPDAEALVVTIQPSGGFPAFDAETMTGLGDFVIVTEPSGRED